MPRLGHINQTDCAGGCDRRSQCLLVKGRRSGRIEGQEWSNLANYMPNRGSNELSFLALRGSAAIIFFRP